MQISNRDYQLDIQLEVLYSMESLWLGLIPTAHKHDYLILSSMEKFQF